MFKNLSSRVFACNSDELTDTTLYEKAYNSLIPSRKGKTDRLRLDSDKRRSVCAGMLLNLALKEYGISSPTVLLGEYGKPYIKEYPDFRFNISHSGSWVIFGVSSFEIGCDIERIREKIPRGLSERFPAYERELINSQFHFDSSVDMFFRLWTLRESYVKATGRGITSELDSFGIVFRNGVPGHDEKNSPYSFYEYDVFDGYKCSVCLKDNGDRNRPELILVDFEAMLKQ